MPDRPITAWLSDMDGVLVREAHAIPGAADFVAALQAAGSPFLVLTNNSIYTRRDLSARLRSSGLDIPEAHIWTSADATARFLDDQRPHGSAFVIGEAGLTTALHEIACETLCSKPSSLFQEWFAFRRAVAPMPMLS